MSFGTSHTFLGAWMSTSYALVVSEILEGFVYIPGNSLFPGVMVPFLRTRTIPGPCAPLAAWKMLPYTTQSGLSFETHKTTLVAAPSFSWIKYCLFNIKLAKVALFENICPVCCRCPCYICFVLYTLFIFPNAQAF